MNGGAILVAVVLFLAATSILHEFTTYNYTVPQPEGAGEDLTIGGGSDEPAADEFEPVDEPDEPITSDAPPELPATLLFSDDFSASLDNWKISAAPKIIDGAVSSDSFVIETSTSFPSKNGIELSFDFLSPSNPSGTFTVTFVEKTFASNYAKFYTVTPTGNLGYHIYGHCVTPAPLVHNQAGPIDGNFHSFIFRAHTNGSAEWIQDGYVQFQRNNFDIDGDYTLMLSGSSLIGSAQRDEHNVFIDNIKIASLNEPTSSSDICKAISPTPAKNPCPYGDCLSNGICCSSYSPYYCEGHCYSSSNAAMSASQGRCVNFRIVC
ncbi:MAG: hypothetical protein ABH829_04945 [archaeon]